MVYRFVNGNFELLYYMDIEYGKRYMIEEAFDRARIKWEEENYADFMLNYFENELDKLNVKYKMVDEFTIEW